MERRTGVRSASRLALRRFHRSGAAPVKVLLIGDRRQLLAGEVDASGTGTPAERVADRIWLTTRRGVDVDALGDLAPVLHAITGVLGGWRLHHYDVVVVVLDDGEDARTRPRAMLRTAELLQAVGADGLDRTEVLVVGTASRRAGSDVERRLRRAVQALATDRVRLCGVASSDDPEERARLWATAIGVEVARTVTRGLRPVPVGEPSAVRPAQRDDGRVAGRAPDPRLDDLVELARTAFGTESAEIRFVDHDGRWRTAAAGPDGRSAVRTRSFHTMATRATDPVVVGDVLLDPVLRSGPLALGPRPVRFYAAHPIRSVDGLPIGSFCVWDPDPRDVRGLDLAVLRDLTLLAQAELIAQDVAPGGAESRLRRA